MKIRFTKMHGLGNDFVVLDAINQAFVPNPAQARYLADRHFGVGCDQILVVEKPVQADVDFRYRIFNADGGEVEQCGNGARCFFRYVVDHGLTAKREIKVETQSGIITLRLEDNGAVTVGMGVPRFSPNQIPFIGDADTVVHQLRLGTHGNTRDIDIGVVSMGNPHAVQVVSNVDTAPVAIDGPLIEAHEFFPQRVNAGFMQVLNRNAIRLRVYERGTGETLACGTGACAAVVSGIRRGLLDSPVNVAMPGSTLSGELSIAWQGAGQSVQMTGPATTVFEGEIELPEEL